MTATEKVLQRKDGSTLLVGIVVALAVLQFLSSVSQPLAAKLMGNELSAANGSFDQVYVLPFVWLVLQLVFLELLIWLVIGVRNFAYATPKKRK